MESTIQKCIFGIIFMLLIYLLIETRMNSLRIKNLTHSLDTMISRSGGSYNKELMDKAKAAYIKPEYALSLYQMMKDTHEILENNKIQYWIDSSTLLGAIRHEGIIPWATRLHLCISSEDEAHLQKMKSSFEALGYAMLSKGNNYTIVALGTTPIDAPVSSLKKYPIIHIAATHKLKNKIIYRDLINRQFLTQAFFFEEELFPLKKYKFGVLEVWGAHNPFEYLDRYFGDWNEFAVIHSYHQSQAASDFLRIRLSEDLRQPALPLGPLEDRVKIKKSELPLHKSIESLMKIQASSQID
jgi:lipopolysaccharide cholinephosphotransferase